jgi:hypothetical protein
MNYWNLMVPASKQQQMNVAFWAVHADSCAYPLEFNCCELLLLEAGSQGRWPFGNLEEGKCPPLKTATKQRLLYTKNNLCVL